ncbi:peroxisome biogenesis factor 2-like [Neocloeon triangulifer]|uniref:peroxisome biogenesis factor 2-like n=1 Tax=Neocloeon triangulifer TaxID=2078957 RepID=UPI00286ED126|nr:peroxisome biogenesis factor 2-like [Neocloeon triangulifer]
MEKEIPKKKHVPRITQLDAASLDKEIGSVLKSQVEEIFRSAAPSLINKFEPEIDALLSLLVWKLSVYDRGATFGQTLLDLKYYNSSRRKKVLLALTIIGGKYFVSRIRSLSRTLTDERNLLLVEQFFRFGDTFFRLANLVNQVVFLTQGKYPGLPERILNMPPTPASDQLNRHVGYSYMTRELLWHSLIELLLFVLPLINYRAWYAKFALFFRPKAEIKDSVSPVLTLTTTCAICNEKPVLPHHIGCGHIFCSYCLKGNLAASKSFGCPLCGALAEDSDMPVII